MLAKEDKRDWREATAETINRLRHVLDLPGVPPDRLTRLDLYNQARMITQALGATRNEFWNIYINVIRILVAAESPKAIPTTRLFD